MFYDPSCKANPLSLESLIAWLERQPANELYSYISIGHCLIAQYLNASGVSTRNVNPRGFWRLTDGGFVELPNSFNSIAYGGDGAKRTFGDALARARAELTSRGG